jgi:hypothetical protein
MTKDFGAELTATFRGRPITWEVTAGYISMRGDITQRPLSFVASRAEGFRRLGGIFGLVLMILINSYTLCIAA